MAKTKISEFSATPANNTDIDGINIAEGCAPSGINDAIRELMAQLKDWQSGTSNDPYVIGSSGSLTLNQGTANGVPYLNGSKVVTSGSALTFDGTNFATTGSVTSAGSSNSGNLAFTGTGNRITGDFTNATVANRVMFQTSTANSSTIVSILPSGTGTATALDVFNNSDPTSSAKGQFVATAASVDIRSAINPGGTYLPMTFFTGGSERMRVDTSGNLGIGTSSPATKLHVAGTGAQQALVQSTNGGTTSLQLLNSGVSSRVVKNVTGALVFEKDSVDQATLDSSGNLGLGVTPSAWTGTFRALQVGSRSAFYQDSGSATALANNIYNDGSNRYIASAASSIYLQGSGAHQWFTAPSGTAGNAISFTQAMMLDASGRLVVGATSTAAKFQVSGASANTYMLIDNAAGGENYFAANVSNIFQTAGVERVRIDSSGNLLVGTTSVYDNSRFTLETSSAQPNGIAVKTFGNNNAMAFWRNSTTYAGAITLSGSGTAYTSASDYRLKNTIAPMTGALAKVALLKPVTYKWNADGSAGQGFIAHELQEVVPDAVTGEKDAVDADGNPKYQGIDTSFLVATLTAAIQEQQAIITALTARVAALESN